MRHFIKKLAEISTFFPFSNWVIGKAWASALFERFWRHFLPLLLVILAFIAFAWLNIFIYAPRSVHIILLALFAAVAAVSVWYLCLLRLPKHEDIIKRIEKDNGLKFEQLRLDSQKLSDDASPQAQILWQEHKKRMHSKLSALKVKLPHPNIPAYDTYGLRSIVFLLWAVAFCFQLGGSGGQLRDALYFGPAKAAEKSRMDAWINPPEYTGRPPVYLLSDNNQVNQNVSDSSGSRHTEPLSVHAPEGSQLTLRVNDYGRGRTRLTCQMNGAKQYIYPKRDEASSLYELQLNKSALCNLAAPGLNTQWAINVEQDKQPQISWNKKPERALNGLLKLNYKIADDYKIKRAWAEITPIEEDLQTSSPTPYFANINRTHQNKQASKTQSALNKTQETKKKQARLEQPLKINLTIPRLEYNSDSQSKTGQATTQTDFSKNPWAGSQATIRLGVEDAAGHKTYTPQQTLVLPQRNFVNPVARALIEQRQILTQNIYATPRVLDMLQAILLSPEKTLKPRTALPLYSLRSRLRQVPPTDIVGQLKKQNIALTEQQIEQINTLEDKLRREKLTDITSYMWAIADGMDGGNLAKAEQNLQAAAQALRDALRNGASQEEVAQLIQNLRDAMQQYLAMRAEKNQNPDKDKNSQTQMLGDNDLEKKLKALEDAAKNGNSGQGEQLLSEFEDLMKNLQVQQGGQGKGEGQNNSQKEQMQKQMDSLSDIMRRQQQLMDDTHRLQEENFRGQNSDKESEEKRQKLQEQQQDLQKDLQDTRKQLEQQKLAPKDSFDKAERQMQDSQKALEQGDQYEALKQQTETLESLRNSAKDVMGKMRDALQKADKEQNKDNGQSEEQKQGKPTDPLGRPEGEAGGQDGSANHESAVQRARRILDEIRNKLGNLTPQQEKEYLERLLQSDDN